ncbi:YlxR family protein [Mycoplasmoides genitalium]
MQLTTRLCLLTRKHFVKRELLRLVKLDNQLEIDLNQNLKGRGYYLSVFGLKLDKKHLKAVVEKHLKVSCNDAKLTAMITALQQLAQDEKK